MSSLNFIASVVLLRATVSAAVLAVAGGSAMAKTVPTDSAHQIVVSDAIITALNDSQIKGQSNGMSDFKSEDRGDYWHVEYKIIPNTHPIRSDFYYDPGRTACFESESTIRCFAQVGFRKVSIGNDVLEDKPFLYLQEEIFLRRDVNDTLTVFRICRGDECRDIK